ncbi:hypothetical protein AB0D87_38110 [Streptomyces sp. NPDC048342]|uniref:cell envelope integrity protein TolA n=1 Tax=unclassified Streptomyces TaxID=2593676 RepID=UPI003413EB0D
MSVTDYRQAQREDRAAERAQDREDRRAAEEARLERERLAQEARLEERRLAQEAEDRRREQDRLDKQAEAERQRAAQELAAKQKREREEADRVAKAAADKERKREKARKAKERRDRWTGRAKAVPGWVSEHLDLAAALAVMACSIVPALVSQASSLRDTGIIDSMGWLGGLLVILLPVMLECSAWAATAGEAKAMKAKRSPWPYRIAVYGFAGLAAWVNYLHGRNVGGQHYGVLLGSVLAASSVVPIAVWQLVQVGRHREFKEEMRAARQERRDAKATKKSRKNELPQVWATARRLRAIAGHTKLSLEDAWQAAWAVHEGAGDGAVSDELLAMLSADMIGLRVDAEERLAVVLGELRQARERRIAASGAASAATAEAVRDGSANGSAKGGTTPSTRSAEEVSTGLLDASGKPLLRTVYPQITPSVPPSARTPETAPARTRETTRPRPRKEPRRPTVRKLSTGAKKAAAETAKQASADENLAIETWIAEELRAGREPNARAVAEETERRRKEVNKKATAPGKTWCYDRIAAVRKLPGLHVVSDQRTA